MDTKNARSLRCRSLIAVSDDVQQRVAHAIEAAPYWNPVQANDKPITQQINYTFVLYNIR